MEDHLGYSYFKVVHPGGCVVRIEPTLSAQSTGLVVSKDSIIPTRNIVSGDGNVFVELVEGGWVVVQKGTLQACIKINGPSMKTGEWLYEVVHPSGARFARTSNISEASDRNEKLHPKGTVLKAISKRTEIESVVTVVQLDQNQGWLFEHANTGEVLDRLGNELVVIASDENRELREFHAKIANPEGVPVLTTPTETSVWKGRLARDQVVPCAEAFRVPVFPNEDDPTGAGGSGGVVTPVQVGLVVYYRLRDQKGWIVASRSMSEPNRPRTQTVEAVEVADGSNAGAADSTSTPNLNSVIPSPRSPLPMNGRPKPAAGGAGGGGSPPGSALAGGDGASADNTVFDFADAAAGVDGFQRLKAPGAPASTAAASSSSSSSSSSPSSSSASPTDRVTEDAPCDAWYRVVYKGGLKLRGSPSMHDLLDGTLPVGCFVKTSRRVVVRSHTQPNPAGGITGVDNAVVFLQLVACVGAKVCDLACLERQTPWFAHTQARQPVPSCPVLQVRVADAWVFESITDLDAAQDSAIIAAEKVGEPVVESQPDSNPNP